MVAMHVSEHMVRWMTHISDKSGGITVEALVPHYPFKPVRHADTV